MKAKAAHTIAVEDLTQAQAKTDLKRLAQEIAEHDERYYQHDAPTISDADYDALRIRNAAIEAHFPGLVRADSPSTRVGSKPARGFAKRRHAVPMLSLDNAFSEQDVTDFVDRIRRFLKLPAGEAVALPRGAKNGGLSLF